jgi:uncharacterized phiE125 gp8 family phage protein
MTLGWRPRDRVVTPAPPVSPIIGTFEMKQHLRVDHDDDDGLIEGLTAAAVAVVEGYTQRLLSQRQIVMLLPSLPGSRHPVELPGGKVSFIASVTINGAAFDGCIAAGDSPALLVPPRDWPSTELGGYPVTVTYTAGYQVTPPDLLVAVKMVCASLYENRHNSASTTQSPVPISAEYLMQKHRIAPI